MGLDMYARSTRPAKNTPTKHTEIAYWRKFNNLHGWMEQLYREKGGTEVFNCENVFLTKEDLHRLREEANAKADTLAPFEGFFFGYYVELTDDDVAEINTFVNNALAEIEAGFDVYYTSWW